MPCFILPDHEHRLKEYDKFTENASVSRASYEVTIRCADNQEIAHVPERYFSAFSGTLKNKIQHAVSKQLKSATQQEDQPTECKKQVRITFEGSIGKHQVMSRIVNLLVDGQVEVYPEFLGDFLVALQKYKISATDATDKNEAQNIESRGEEPRVIVDYSAPWHRRCLMMMDVLMGNELAIPFNDGVVISNAAGTVQLPGLNQLRERLKTSDCGRSSEFLSELRDLIDFRRREQGLNEDNCKALKTLIGNQLVRFGFVDEAHHFEFLSRPAARKLAKSSKKRKKSNRQRNYIANNAANKETKSAKLEES